MNFDRRQCLKGAAGFMAGGLLGSTAVSSAAMSQSRAETLRHVTGATFTSLDPTAQGATRESPPLSMNIYDRLVAFGRKPAPGGYVFDFDNIRGELAERFERSADGTRITYHLRESATWHDGSPVTADDVKWSLDRNVTANNLGKAQLANGSITSTDQIKVVGDHQIEILVGKPDRLAVATVAVPFIPMFNSKLAKQHATVDDPWAINWLKENTAAGGAYMVESHRPGQQLTLKRNDNWKSGPDGKLPAFQRVIVQTIPDVSARVSLVERGDADLTLDAAASDITGIERRGKARVFSVPQSNVFQCVSFNTTATPFNDVKLRRAVAMALPYDDMYKAAIFGRGKKLYGGTWTEATDPSLMQPMPNKYDLDLAKKLLAEAGHGSGLKTSFAFPASVAATVEPMAALIKESLAKIGIEVAVQKLPDAQFTTMVVERRLAMFFDFGTSWLPTPDYFTRVFLSGTGRWNSSGWNDPEVVKSADEARFMLDQSQYNAKMRHIVNAFAEAMPMAMLWSPNHDAIIGKDIDGYTYWFHRNADYRDLKRI